MTFSVFSALFSDVWSIVWVILCFGGSIFVHELGHFLAAKWCGLQVERFSIGLGPKVLSWKRNGVEYCLSLLPFGGFVSLPQLADMELIEGKSASQALKLPPATYKQKIIVSLAGVCCNMLFALVLACVLWKVGLPKYGYYDTTTIGYVEPKLFLNEAQSVVGPAYKAGLQPGDAILKVDGETVKDFEAIRRQIVIGSGRTNRGEPEVVLTMAREGKVWDQTVYPELMETNPLAKDTLRAIGIYPAHPLIVANVLKGSPAERAGVQPKDILMALEDHPLYSLPQVNALLESFPAQALRLTLLRTANKGQQSTADEQHTVLIKAQRIPYTKPVIQLTYPKDASIYLGILPKASEALSEKDSSELLLYSLSKEAAKALPAVALGDQVYSVGGRPVHSLEQFLEYFEAGLQTTGSVAIGWTRAGKDLPSTQLDNNWKSVLKAPEVQTRLGVQLETGVTLAYPLPWQQIAEGFSMTVSTLKSLLQPASDIKVHHLMGPPGILRTLHTFSLIDWRLLLWFVMVMNINLACLNLLPIPVLDGGQIVFATLQKLFKAFTNHWVGRIQNAFIFVLLGFIVYISFFDIQRWRGDIRYAKQQEMLQYYYRDINLSLGQASPNKTEPLQ